jgi:hypothetical protein
VAVVAHRVVAHHRQRRVLPPVEAAVLGRHRVVVACARIRTKSVQGWPNTLTGNPYWRLEP